MGVYQECLICPPGEFVGGKTQDHLVPKVVAHDYPRAFTGVFGKRINFVDLCRPHHALVDDTKTGKVGLYYSWGLVGLVRYLAHYPRSSNPITLDYQYDHWMTLFGEMRKDFRELSKDNLDDEYTRLHNLTDEFLTRWQQGGVEDFIKTGFKSLPTRRNGLVRVYQPMAVIS